MATIINCTDVAISIAGKGYRYRLPCKEPGKRTKKPSIPVPDDHAKDWMSRNDWVQRGLVMVKMGDAPTVAEKRPHWRLAVAAAKDLDDLDVLESMHEAEDRPVVREAIEARMTELRE